MKKYGFTIALMAGSIISGISRAEIITGDRDCSGGTGTCHFYIDTETQTMTIEGTGDIYFSDKGLTQYALEPYGGIKHVVVGEGLTRLTGENTGGLFDKTISLTLPSTITDFSQFLSGSVSSITIPDTASALDGNYNILDFSNIDIQCIGNADTCSANLAAAGITPKSVSVYTPKESKPAGSREIKRIYTVDEAVARTKELGGDTFTFKLRYK